MKISINLNNFFREIFLLLFLIHEKKMFLILRELDRALFQKDRYFAANHALMWIFTRIFDEKM